MSTHWVLLTLILKAFRMLLTVSISCFRLVGLLRLFFCNMFFYVACNPSYRHLGPCARHNSILNAIIMSYFREDTVEVVGVLICEIDLLPRQYIDIRNLPIPTCASYLQQHLKTGNLCSFPKIFWLLICTMTSSWIPVTEF